MRHSGDPRPSKPKGKFIPNKAGEPQLGRLRIKKRNGAIVEIPMNRKER